MGSENFEYSNEIPIWKFAFLSIITFGIYDIYWMYKQWKFFKVKDDLKIRPFWRAIFSLFFIASLLERIEKFTTEQGADAKYPYAALALFWIAANYSSRLPDPFYLVSFLAFLAFIQPVKAMNFYWNKTQPELPHKPFRWWQIILMIPLMLFLALVLAGILLPLFL